MRGGKKGLLENSVNLCARSGRAVAQIDGQNGKSAGQRPLLGTGCKKKAGKRKARSPHGAGR